MVAVYAIGWPCSEELVDKYPQIKPAESSDDLGTVISFDCEAEEVSETFIYPKDAKACTINPLNWSTDTAPADKALNDGACFTNYSGEIVNEVGELCGCYIDEERGVVKVTDISPEDYPAYLSLLPDGAYHIYDYQFFYRNLQENVTNRINIYNSVSLDGKYELDDSAEVNGRQQITKDFIGLMEADPELEALMKESIYIASLNNPDRKTNPVQSLDDYYDFLDWSATCMPWNILDGQDESDLYKSIDQSLDYFYYLLDQPLPELAGKGYYYPCLEYHEPIASWCKKYASTWGEFLSTNDSWNDEYYGLVCSDEDFGMNKGWYADSNVWNSFNEWFSRYLSDKSVRPISDADIISPADSTPQGIWNIDENSQIDMGVQLKSSMFSSVEQIIGEDSEYETCFANGTLTHTFLDVNDYHRYHFPVSGKILEVRKIPALDAVGGLVSWSEDDGKYLLHDDNPCWQSIETRDCLIMDTEYGLVAILPIAMSQVSSCNWEDSVKVGAEVEKGDPMGYFLFGGSDIVMIFQEGVSLELASREHILMGEPYAEVVSSKLSEVNNSTSDDSRIYFAAPLFSEAEREYNLKIVKILEDHGYEVFLPQRDGFLAPELEGKTEAEKTEMIFQKDKEEVLKSDILFMLLDGRVPDEGACVELGIAYANGKRCYGFKSDARSVELDMDLNPMITGCFTKLFYDIDSEKLVQSLEDYLENNKL